MSKGFLSLYLEAVACYARSQQDLLLFLEIFCQIVLHLTHNDLRMNLYREPPYTTISRGQMAITRREYVSYV